MLSLIIYLSLTSMLKIDVNDCTDVDGCCDLV